ncbi:MAG TPA: CheB methylesterase domain-containing protein [Spirochaetota bacterium]|nr:CheB methylesterase domain-containing protein [Spirochaetota bacterium]HPF08035.1 CheB methylesterase domain-containing protein [Spirochaetota bacterium]HPR39338.1 CheB methylesterase domain-containing protein [Spirochaetota bacterium]HRX49605.1 CheB methylesterase domain-containing protein [Spirochaetota bacterium]
MTDEDFKILLIGSSTGALPVIEGMLKTLNKDYYAVLIAQHMPEGYTGMWAERLRNHTPFAAYEGVNNDEVRPGKAYIAPGNRHMFLREGEPFRIGINDDPPVNRFRPSVDVLFGSAIEHDPSRIIAVILTGMCDDGVHSMIELRRRGILTIAQNKETSVVFGMNKEAIDRGGAELVLSPDEMVEYLNRIKDERGPRKN